MKKILVPIDFSDYSINAVTTAIRLAADTASEVRLLHVFDDPFVTHDMEKVTFNNEVTRRTEELLHKMETDAKSKMSDMESDVYRFMQENNLTVPLTVELRRGFAVDQIVAGAREWIADVIVVGARGHSRFEKMLFGTVTKGVIDDAHCPVLALPADFQWKHPKELMYATDFNDYDAYAIAKLLNLFQVYPVRLHVTHFNLDNNHLPDEEKMQALHDTFQSYGRNNLISYEIVDGKVLLSALNEYMAAKDIDLLAVTTRKMSSLQRIFSKSASINLLYHAHKPLLVFHEK